MRQLIEDLISMMEYHVEQTRPIHSTTVALQAAREALKSLPPQRTEPICPECKAKVLYECVACSSNNYPPKRTEQEPVAWMFEDDEDKGHKTFRQTPPSPEVVAYLAKWNLPACVPIYTTPPQRTEQEPVAWMFEDDEDNGHKTFRQTPPSPEVVAYLAKWNRPAWVPIYTTPPQRTEQEPLAIDGNTSDGYHTFNELYEFRKAYNAALFNEWAAGGKCSVHKSWRHHDGELCFGGGWFIVVAVLPNGQISNHYEAKDWNLFGVPETERALFEFDGHTSIDVVARLKAYTTPPQRTEQEPAAWCTRKEIDDMAKGFSQDVPARAMRIPQSYPEGSIVKLYTHPPPRTWVGLTDEEFESIAKRKPSWALFDFYRLIEAKLKEKNCL